MSTVFAPPQPPHAPPQPPASVPSPHRAHWWTRRWLKTPVWAWMIIALFGIGVASSLASPEAANSPAAQQPATTAPRVATPPLATEVAKATETSAAPTTVRPTTAEPVATLPSVKAQFETWTIVNSLQTRTQGLSDAMGGAADATTPVEMGAACADVHNANELLHDALPSPSPEFNQAMEKAYTDFDTATHYCTDGVDTLDATKLSLAADYLTLGNADIQAATAIMGSI